MLLDEEIAKFKSLKLAGYSVTIRMKLPIDRDAALRGFASFQSDFPSFQSSKMRNEGDEIAVNTKGSGALDGAFLRLKSFNFLDLTWGKGASFDSSVDVSRALNCIQDGFSIHPFAIESLDFRVHLYSEWKGQHYQAILDTYYAGSPLRQLFDPGRVIDLGIDIRGRIDDERIAVLAVASDLTVDEIADAKYDNSRLKVLLAFGLVNGFSASTRLSDAMTRHLEIALEFARNRFIPFVCMPLDELLTSRA
ncbi:MAG: hypothetical protein ACT4P9_10315 [Betaproteobacteria bacterium]